jgi:hypothetical protein
MQGKHHALIHTRMANPVVTTTCDQLIKAFQPARAATSVEFDEFVEPKQSISNKEAFHLIAAIIKDERAPVHVLAKTRVFMFVETGAGKWPGTESRITPMPAWWQRSTKLRNSSGFPCRLVGA